MRWDRVPPRDKPILELARSLIPQDVSRDINPSFLFRARPEFVGLHSLGSVGPLAGSDYGFQECAHACQAWFYGEPIVVVPRPELYPDPISVIVHEIGHIWDEASGYSLDAPETTAYSRTNREERIAEAFELIIMAEYRRWGGWLDRIDGEDFRPLRQAMGLCA